LKEGKVFTKKSGVTPFWFFFDFLEGGCIDSELSGVIEGKRICGIECIMGNRLNISKI
jgi:hypothetical protein